MANLTEPDETNTGAPTNQFTVYGRVEVHGPTTMIGWTFHPWSSRPESLKMRLRALKSALGDFIFPPRYGYFTARPAKKR